MQEHKHTYTGRQAREPLSGRGQTQTTGRMGKSRTLARCLQELAAGRIIMAHSFLPTGAHWLQLSLAFERLNLSVSGSYGPEGWPIPPTQVRHTSARAQPQKGIHVAEPGREAWQRPASLAPGTQRRFLLARLGGVCKTLKRSHYSVRSQNLQRNTTNGRDILGHLWQDSPGGLSSARIGHLDCE